MLVDEFSAWGLEPSSREIHRSEGGAEGADLGTPVVGGDEKRSRHRQRGKGRRKRGVSKSKLDCNNCFLDEKRGEGCKGNFYGRGLSNWEENRQVSYRERHEQCGKISFSQRRCQGVVKRV